jgi:hypothetical protein
VQRGENDDGQFRDHVAGLVVGIFLPKSCNSRALLATPIIANGVLYESAGAQRAVAAIDAATGKQLGERYAPPGKKEDPEW